MRFHNGKPLVVAIDGPAASGKGTLGRRLAKELGLVYLDTGLLYRYVGSKAMEAGVDLKAVDDGDEAAIKKVIEIADSRFGLANLEEASLGDEKTGMAASVISAIPAVRRSLIEFQREIASNPNGAVLDGRDIGTVICPDARYKFFITASLEARAKRRYKQLQNQGIQVIYDSVLGDLKKRDERDTERKVSPLTTPEGAAYIDTTDMDMNDVLAEVLSIVSPSF